MSELAALTRQRSSIKSRLTIFINFINNNFSDDAELQHSLLDALKVRLARFESLIDEFENIQGAIECNTDSDLNHEMQNREEFESKYFNIIIRARNIIESNQLNNQTANCSHNHNSRSNSTVSENVIYHDPGLTQSQSHVPVAASAVPAQVRQTESCGIKLPTINLPRFNGQYEKWLEFHDTFQSLIHDNGHINTINKFHYLRSSLDGSAALTISTLEFSASNYQIAWQLICDRYHNTRVLKQNHLKQLFSLQPINKESSFLLRNMIDNINKNLMALNTLGEPTDKWDTLIIYLASTKIDQNTLHEWEKYKADKETNLTLFFQFIRSRADLLDAIRPHSSHKTENKVFTKPSAYGGVVTQQNKIVYTCQLCKGTHPLFYCKQFRALSPENRVNEINKLKLCMNCLKSNHKTEECKSNSTCKQCSEKHNSLLHGTSSSSAVDTVQSALWANINNRQVVLSTAIIYIANKDGSYIQAKALLDSGSQCSFITEQLANKLQLQRHLSNHTIVGVNNITTNCTQYCDINIKSLITNYHSYLHCIILPTITNKIPQTQIEYTFKLPTNIKLADSTFYTPSDIDILLGADIFWELIQNERIKLGKNSPTLIKTKLGWILSGFIYNQHKLINNYSTKHCNFVSDVRDQLSRFWEIEEVDYCAPSTSEHHQCEQHFVKTTSKTSQGQFCVSIPIKNNGTEMLGNSFNMAYRRFLSLERKLSQQPILKEMYHKFMREYESLGHMSEVSFREDSQERNSSYYAPHHGILNTSSSTTKLRVVFDCSAKTNSGYSFNDIQLVGPKVQDDIIDILLRFRQYKIILSADVDKMYRRIVVSEEQRKLQKILMRYNTNEQIKIYKLNTLTYGTASAPFLATRCIREIAHQCKDSTIAQIIAHDFYVDDLLTGADTENEAISIGTHINQLLQSSGFQLRKWRSNKPNILRKFIQTISNENVMFCIDEQTKTLGLGWQHERDQLYFSFSLEKSNLVQTKRIVMGIISSIFDPLGLISICVIEAKIILQQLWKQNLAWDDELPKEIMKNWNVFLQSLHKLSELRIPRRVFIDNPITKTLHLFSDASQLAYGACAYVSAIYQSGIKTSTLLCSKSRVAPIKSLTIPRLELSGALLAAKLYKRIINTMRTSFDEVHFWTDSTIVIGWMKLKSRSLKAFVKNRVSEINSITHDLEWKYVPTKQNPADLITRGVSSEVIHDCKLWWHGPDFLLLNKEDWPINPQSQIQDLPEIQHTITTLYNNVTSTFSFHNYSNYNTLKRIVAYLNRFIYNCKIRHKATNNQQNNCLQDIRVGVLSTLELKEAFIKLIKMAQLQTFNTQYNIILNGKELSSKDILLKFNPFIDSDGILRVGGRLMNAPFSYDKKHPIIIQSTHHLTKLIFRSEHIRLMHAGPQLLLSSIRETFWPVGGRNLAKLTVHKCITCFRQQKHSIQPIMGQLPEHRVTPSFPFENTGIDYGGPIMTINKKGRGSRLIKSYIAVFVCLATKAVHVEGVTDLSSNSFILTLKRFISRRGKPSHIYCDNGTNFVGAYNDIKRFLKGNSISEISNEFLNEGIQFHFSPAYSPNYGGLWEASIKSVKYHIKRVVGNSHLTFEEFSTLLAQIEAILNSRPLCPLTTDHFDITDDRVLTPAHFLIGRTLTALPSPSYQDIQINRLNRYERIEQIKHHFWNRWYKDYIHHLQQRVKWRRSSDQIKEGTMVIIKDPFLPPMKWHLGRITKSYPGRDGVNRVFDVQTKNGVIRRSVSTVCPLPISE